MYNANQLVPGHAARQLQPSAVNGQVAVATCARGILTTVVAPEMTGAFFAPAAAAMPGGGPAPMHWQSAT
jgi:hypothetical protein